MKNKIIIPTDLTKTAGQAVQQAAVIAARNNSSLTLLHVFNEKSPSQEDVRKKLVEESENIYSKNGVHCDFLIREGNIFEVIPFIAHEHEYDIMVMGTHGVKGFKQLFFGPNILKLVSKIPLPVLVVQEETPLIKNFKKIVLPVSSHETFNTAVDAVLFFTGIFDCEVHLYSVHKAGFEWPERLLTNIEMAIRRFELKGTRMIRAKEEQNVYSMGYAKQTLNYARAVKADLICTMSVASEEYYYFADSDKESILLNEDCIPILCAGGV